jgi:hypothetical protein
MFTVGIIQRPTRLRRRPRAADEKFQGAVAFGKPARRALDDRRKASIATDCLDGASAPISTTATRGPSHVPLSERDGRAVAVRRVKAPSTDPVPWGRTFQGEC